VKSLQWILLKIMKKKNHTVLGLASGLIAEKDKTMEPLVCEIQQKNKDTHDRSRADS
jgi:hypothetical protein